MVLHILLEFPLDWNDKMTLFLIIFSTGLLCLVCAILLAVYLLRSDKFLDKPKDDKKSMTYPSYKDFEEESRLSTTKSKIVSFFGRIKRLFSHHADGDNSEFRELDSIKSLEDELSAPLKDEIPPTENDS